MTGAEARLLPLPDGNWVEQFGRPCPECGASMFVVALVRHRTAAPNVFREAVESFCPTCPLASHRGHAQKTVIGRHNLATGVLTLTHYLAREG